MCFHRKGKRSRKLVKSSVLVLEPSKASSIESVFRVSPLLTHAK